MSNIFPSALFPALWNILMSSMSIDSKLEISSFTQLAFFQAWLSRVLIQMPGCCFSGPKPTVCLGKKKSPGEAALVAFLPEDLLQRSRRLLGICPFYGFCCEACAHKQLEVTVLVGQRRSVGSFGRPVLL